MKYSIRPIAFRPEWVDIFGDIKSAIIYQQLYYWSDKGERQDGWIYKTVKDLEYETTIEEDTQLRILKKLKENGWIDIKSIKIESDNRLRRHFRILKYPEVPPAKCGGDYPQNAGSDTAKCGVSSYTKSTNKEYIQRLDSADAPKITPNEEFIQSKLSELITQGMDEKLALEELRKFVGYWTEPNNKGKQRWQCEKFFEINRRWVTWIGRVKDKYQPKVVVHTQSQRKLVRV